MMINTLTNMHPRLKDAKKLNKKKKTFIKEHNARFTYTKLYTGC